MKAIINDLAVLIIELNLGILLCTICYDLDLKLFAHRTGTQNRILFREKVWFRLFCPRSCIVPWPPTASYFVKLPFLPLSIRILQCAAQIATEQSCTPFFNMLKYTLSFLCEAAAAALFMMNQNGNGECVVISSSLTF